MHVIIINGSPRVRKFSNTDKIITRLAAGMKRADPDMTYELFSISDKNQWEAAKQAFADNENILIALPLYVECIPGLLLEFLNTLEQKAPGTRISFVLQSGFAEASQLRCGEEYLKRLPAMLGCTYGGTLVKGDNFSFRFLEEKETEHQLAPYEKMGEVFIRSNGFDNEEARAFSGPEYFGFGMRLLLGIIFRTAGPFMFRKIARSLGCTRDLKYRPYETS